MTLIACVIVLMSICVAAVVYGIHLLYKAIKYRSISDTGALVTVGRCFGGVAFAGVGLIGLMVEVACLLLLQKP